MREEFDTLIGTAPVSAINLDDIARHGRRVRQRRSITIGAAALALLTMGSFAVIRLDQGKTRRPNPTVSTSPSPTPSNTPLSDAQRLVAALTQAIATHAPQVTFTEPLVRLMECRPDRIPAGPDGAPVPCPSGEKYLEDPKRSFMWQGTVTSSTGTYTIQAFIDYVGPNSYIDPSSPPIDAEDAEERRIAIEQGNAPERGPNGENILAKDYEINMVKPDGTSILIRAFDTNTEGAYMGRSPFTRDQLIAIALEPDLDL